MTAATTNTTTSPWVVFPKRQPEARLRLFCFPYAGAGASAYHPWGRFISPEIEVVAIQLPGRETRLREAAHTRLTPMVAVLAQSLEPLFDRPFAFFGHSLGALIAFELARELRRTGRRQPDHLTVSARRPPQLPDTDSPLHSLPQAAFVDSVQKRYNALPEVILKDQELLDLYLPALRADFEMLETYAYSSEEPLACSILALGGRDDARASREQLAQWELQTVGAFDLTLFDGGHFYLQPQRESVLQTLSRYLLG
jgi:medium-chain acyl-[acyl-carrier-protein] hydrolase